MNLTALSSSTVLDSYFLEARCKILDVAAILDRISRGCGSEESTNDPRLLKIREALQVLLDRSGRRAEQIQQIFSLEYDPTWEKPQPKF